MASANTLRNGLGLTMRQAEIMRWRLTGFTHRQIAQRLGLSVPTVKVHVYNAYQTLGISSPGELAVVVARRAGVDLVAHFERLCACPRSWHARAPDPQPSR